MPLCIIKDTKWTSGDRERSWWKQKCDTIVSASWRELKHRENRAASPPGRPADTDSGWGRAPRCPRRHPPSPGGPPLWRGSVITSSYTFSDSLHRRLLRRPPMLPLVSQSDPFTYANRKAFTFSFSVARTAAHIQHTHTHTRTQCKTQLPLLSSTKGKCCITHTLSFEQRAQGLCGGKMLILFPSAQCYYSWKGLKNLPCGWHYQESLLSDPRRFFFLSRTGSHMYLLIFRNPPAKDKACGRLQPPSLPPLPQNTRIVLHPPSRGSLLGLIRTVIAYSATNHSPCAFS